jgi:surfeit locus 1 family protein
LSAPASSGARRSMKKPAPPSAARTSTRKTTITIFMKNDYSTDPTAASAGSSPPHEPRRGAGSTRSRIVWFVVALGCALLTARFGVWQLSRAHTKLANEAMIAERGVMPALAAGELARDPATAETQWQRHIDVTGEWDAAHTVYLMNRTMDERSGFYVMTPLRLPDGGAVVVQRGWIARDDADPMKAPAVPTPAGTVKLHGHVAPWPSHWIDIGHGAGGPVRQNLERAAFGAETGLSLRPATVVEDATADNARDGLRRDWPSGNGGVSVTTNYGYAVQWFAMSIAFLGLYVWLQFIRPRRPAAPDSESPIDATVDHHRSR